VEAAAQVAVLVVEYLLRMELVVEPLHMEQLLQERIELVGQERAVHSEWDLVERERVQVVEECMAVH
jgi:hypothetical protein